MKIFSPTVFRASSSTVFNEVQYSGKVRIESKNRPDMIVILNSEFRAMEEKIRQLTELVSSRELLVIGASKGTGKSVFK
jgi:PHD/YefM family antitoxin component YafN of YafNO toxin-antitoxin module